MFELPLLLFNHRPLSSCSKLNTFKSRFASVPYEAPPIPLSFEYSRDCIEFGTGCAIALHTKYFCFLKPPKAEINSLTVSMSRFNDTYYFKKEKGPMEETPSGQGQGLNRPRFLFLARHDAHEPVNRVVQRE